MITWQIRFSAYIVKVTTLNSRRNKNYGGEIDSTLGMTLKKSMHGCRYHDKTDKKIIGKQSMINYVREQLCGVTQVVKANKTMVAV